MLWEAIMSKVRFVFGVGFAGLVAIALTAAQGPRNQGGMSRGAGMGMGMMGGMMQDPAHQSVLNAFVLPELQSELGLTAQQTTQLKEFKQELLTKGEDFSKQIAARQKELAGLIAASTSKNAEVKRALEEIANLRAQQEFAAYETAGKMKAALTDEQRAKLAALKPFELHQAMMSRMTMGDMTRMMPFMGGDGGMMGMMGRGMMAPEGMPGAAPKQ
jgi:hypothetical protein